MVEPINGRVHTVKCIHGGVYTNRVYMVEFTYGVIYTQWSLHLMESTHGRVSMRCGLQIVGSIHSGS